ncbi:MAG TPA: DUF2306 domain-containing protein [Gammaproteobacteria bacterium]|nr:DUF2306 domain-containing protein [Gammaproteobacteria bacterium]
MATVNSARISGSNGLKKSLPVVVALVAIFFVYQSVLRYFVWSETVYGYYWEFRLPLIAHVTGGLIALLAGVWQVWTGLNVQAMTVHPWTGRLYVLGVLLGSFGAFVLSFTSALFGFAWAAGLVCLALAWLATTGTALYAIRKRNLLLHKQWMIRSYIVTFAFVVFRLVTDYVPYEAWWGVSRPEMSTAAIWAVWVLPLLAYEIALGSRRA